VELTSCRNFWFRY